MRFHNPERANNIDRDVDRGEEPDSEAAADDPAAGDDDDAAAASDFELANAAAGASMESRANGVAKLVERLRSAQ